MKPKLPNMLILKSIYKKIKIYVKNYNNYCIDEANYMSMQDFFDEAFEFILEHGDDTDFTKAQHLIFLDRSNLGVYYNLKEEHKKHIKEKMNRSNDNKIDEHDMYNFILKSYLYGVYESKIKKKAVKKALSEDTRYILLFLDKYNMLGNLKDIREDAIILKECPLCGHEEFFIYSNSGICCCCRGSCSYNWEVPKKKDLFDLLAEETNNFGGVIYDLYDIIKQSKEEKEVEFKKVKEFINMLEITKLEQLVVEITEKINNIDPNPEKKEVQKEDAKIIAHTKKAMSENSYNIDEIKQEIRDAFLSGPKL